MENENVFLNETQVAGDIYFEVPGYEGPILEIKANGDFIVKGKKVENYIEIYHAMKEWLATAK